MPYLQGGGGLGPPPPSELFFFVPFILYSVRNGSTFFLTVLNLDGNDRSVMVGQKLLERSECYIVRAETLFFSGR